MELKNLKPRSSKIFIKKIEQEVRLRPWTVEDQIWLEQEFEGGVVKIFDPNNIDIVAICRIVYRLITDKSLFKAEEKQTFDEDGNEVIERVGGWKKFATMLRDTEEQMSIYFALTECIGMSMPDIEKAKKKVMEAMKNPTGQKS